MTRGKCRWHRMLAALLAAMLLLPTGLPLNAQEDAPTSSQASEPEKESSEPERAPSEPEMEPSEPEMESSEPEKESSEPERAPSEPEKESSEPERAPSEPEMEPSKPEEEPPQESGWDLQIQTPEEPLPWDIREGGHFPFSIQASPLQEEAFDSYALTASLTLPEPLQFMEGEPSYQSGQISLDGTPAVMLEGLPEGAWVDELDREENTLSFSLEWEGDPSLRLKLELLGESLQLPERPSTLASALPASRLAEPESEGLPVALELELFSGSEGEDLSLQRSERASLLLQAGEILQVTSWLEAYEQPIFWVDNNNEENRRPSTDSDGIQPVISFQISPGMEGFQELTEETMAQLGLEELPQGTLEEVRTGQWRYRLPEGQLPTAFTVTDLYGESEEYTVVWQFTPQAAEGYGLVEVNEENLDEYPSVNGQTGWYYPLEETLRFHLDLRVGNASLGNALLGALLTQFQLSTQWTGGSMESLLQEIQENISLSEAGIVIEHAWRYNLDGSLISFKLEEAGDFTGRLSLDGLGEDYLAISYDNSQASNDGSATDALYPGGTLVLTLTGEKQYQASKVWLDAGTEEAKENRPQGEFQLWRYRKGESYTTAAPVRNADGTLVILDLTREDQQITFQVDFDGDGQARDALLPKYDAEGFEYLYVVREYLEGSGYEQVFGQVQEDGSVLDWVDADGTLTDLPGARPAGNTFLYNGGTLSNRISGQTQSTVTKMWDAATFQSNFEGIAVTLKLQSRPEGSPDGTAWQDAGQTVTLEKFFSESLSATATRSVPRYDAHGRPLEYQWVESAVLQNGVEIPLTPNEDGSSSFTLEQDGRQVRYQSTTQVREDGSTLVTNSIDNTINYQVEKVWLGADGQPVNPPQGESITLQIYRTLSGQGLSGGPVASFTLDGTSEEEATLVNEQLGIYAQETAPWKATVTGLEEYDAGGRQYEYLLLESQGPDSHFPTYETQRTEEGYVTTVYNQPGSGHRVMVRKDWIDDSDVSHREPVTLQAYARDTNQPIEGASLTLGNGIWYGYIGIGSYRPEQVYVLETQVGDTSIPLQDYYLGQADAPSFEPAPPEEYEGTADDQYTAIQYTTGHHVYEATYGREWVAGELFYTATNRRLGNIDLTVTKNWVDGDGQTRQAIQAELKDLKEAGIELSQALRLEFADANLPNYYQITQHGLNQPDTVTIGSLDDLVQIQDGDGNPASSLQEIDLESPNSTYAFHHLPKYDRTGSVVHYTVIEVWVDGDGAEVPMDKLREIAPGLYRLLEPYGEPVYTPGDYISGDDTLHAADQQELTVTNQLQGSKNVRWHKQWNDSYNYTAGRRPDIYLDIYQQVHTEDGGTQIQLYQANYRWTYNQDGSGLSSPEHHWHANLSNLPKYDHLGYEIRYYAVEHTQVDAGAFDYQPVGYAYPLDLDPENPAFIGNENQIDSPGEGYAIEISELEGDSQTPHYALLEEGTFANALSADVTIRGQKLWENLPAGYPAADLPAVTFALDQYRGDTLMQEGIATLTISNWAQLAQSGGYSFQLAYTGENVLELVDGVLTCKPADGNTGATPLPRYDGEGRLYSYTLREQSISGSDGSPNWEAIFTPQVNTYRVTNTYYGDQAQLGDLTFKKLLQLPVNEDGTPLAYPAVRFQLTRTYETNAGTPSASQVVEELVWSSAKVQEAYEAQKNPLVEGVLTFEDLPAYAPNGSLYNYTITERKAGFLEGYGTWAKKGNLEQGEFSDEPEADSVSGLSPTPNQEIQATFLNRQVDGQPITLTGQKVWQDFENTLNTRPTELGLTLYRRANAQSQQGNSIPTEPVPTDSYTVTWPKKTADTWTYEITGLERYAPNGMPWIYMVEEAEIADYTPSPANRRVGQAKQDAATGDITMQTLTNAITTRVPYSKTWVDSEGDPITEDYLGVELSVEFRLQVSVDGKDGGFRWEDPETFFREHLTPAQYQQLFREYSFTQTQRGTITDSAVWGRTHSFANLPAWLPGENGTTTPLAYRVVETVVFYGGYSQRYQVVEQQNGSYSYETDGLFAPYYGAGETSYSAQQRQLSNQLKTRTLTVAKHWVGDHQNRYATRPASGNSGNDWEITLLIQRSTDGGASWKTVTDGEGAPLLAHVYGKNNQDTASTVLGGLPAQALDGTAYTYRAVELEPGEDPLYWHQPERTAAEAEDALVEAGRAYHTAYTAGYSGDSLTTVTNTLEDTSLSAAKVWQGPPASSLTLEVQYLGADGRWSSFPTPAVVTLNGETDSDPTAPCYEDGAWHAVWNGLPVAMPGSDLSQNGRTQYAIVETVPEGYLSLTPTQQAVEQGGAAAFTNAQTTSLAVEKVWGLPEGEKSTAPTVVVGLYRTTNPSQVGQADGEPVLDGQGNLRTLTLTAKNLTGSFTGLPKHDPEGNLYSYYALERTVDGQPAAESSYAIYYHQQPGKTTVVNVGRLDITGTKTWKDNGNSYGTRPDSLELRLYRKTASGTEALVAVQPTWTGTKGDQWTYLYEDLPQADEWGNLYTYRVEEAEPTPATGEDAYEGIQEDWAFINTLTGTVDLTVEKHWVDNGDAFGQRPEEVTLYLYADGQPTGQKATLTSPAPDTDRWTAQFTGLPEYDTDGRRIVYTVREDPVPAGYLAEEEGLVVTNTYTGRLSLEKWVTGSRGDREKPFPFAVTLLDGRGIPLAGSYPYTLTRADGSTLEGALQSGEQVSLCHGEQLVIRDLPHGAGYQIVEGDNAGYRVTQLNATGVIQAGVLSQASFTNYRGNPGGGDGGSDDRDPPPRLSPPSHSQEPTPSTPPREELPHTGQNWLLPALLGVAGLASVGMGLYRRRRDGR